jgi:hypothetical protein
MKRSVTVRELHRFSCPCGAELTATVPSLVDCRAGGAVVESSAPLVQCSECGRDVTADVATLLYRGDDLAAAIFIPGEHTSLETDGEEARRLLHLLERRLGRPPLRPWCRLLVAPRRLAEVAARRPVTADAAHPATVLIGGIDEATLRDYQAWLSAIRGDLAVEECLTAVKEIVAAPTWADAADVCRASPVLREPSAAVLVESTFDWVSAESAADRAAIERCQRFVRTARESGRDAYDVPIPDLDAPLAGATPAVQQAVQAALAASSQAVDHRICHLRTARDAWTRAYRSDSATGPVAVSQALAGELHRRGGPADIEEAFEVLQSAASRSRELFGATSLEHLRLLNDLAVVHLDRPVGDRRANGRAAQELLRSVECAIHGDDDQARLLLVDVRLNLGVAALESIDSSDRSESQEEGITWLEQALATGGELPATTEAMICSNLGAAYRSRLAGDRADNLVRAADFHARGVARARKVAATEAAERLVATLAMAATASADMGDHDGAVAAFSESLALAERTQRGAHPTVLRAMANFGSTLHDRFLAQRHDRPDAAAADLERGRVMLERAAHTMAQTDPPHPMLPIVHSNLAALLAEHAGGAGRVDAPAAAALFHDLVETLDPDADPFVLRSVGWNAGMFYLGDGETARAAEFFAVGWRSARALADRALLVTSQANELRAMSRHAHRLALATCAAGSSPPLLTEAFDALDASRARLVGGVTERARLALDHPALTDETARRALLTAREALDHQILEERQLPLAAPEQRRQLARTTRARVEDALAVLNPFLRDAADVAWAATLPVVHLATSELGTAVIIRFPDGETAGFTGNLRDEHVAPVVDAAAGPNGRMARLADALNGVLPVLGEEVAEPLTTHLLGRGWRAAIVIPGGAAALLPLPAAPLRGFGQARDGQMIDVVSLRFAPAYRLLRPAAAADAAPQHFLGIVDPTLPAGRWELAGATPSLLAAAEDGSLLDHIERSDLTARLAIVDWLHLAVHGEQNDGDPFLAQVNVPGIVLPLMELLTDHRLRHGSTVVAPACRAGRVHPSQLDEALSVAHGLLAAGAETVIAGLWDIPDRATALIIARFYALLDDHDLWAQPEVALRSAQRWLRDATWDQLDQQAAAARRDPNSWLAAPLAAGLQVWLRTSRDRQPFAHPVFWSGLVTLSTRCDNQ